ncbi:MAG: DUF3996 domain-containing protein [Proteobacteria bacterium]|nr:DUF3996 domain-containing protein [Pseudomonadota bacterium]
MKRTILTAFAGLAILVALAPEVTARPRPTQASKSFEANKTFGLGVELGEPSGLTGKYFTSPSGAIDFGIGAFGYYGFRNRYADGGLHIYADYLFHPLTLVSTEAFELPLYVGIGGRYWRYGYNQNGYNDDSALGLRVPAGISFDFNNVPIDIFVQLCFTLDFYHQYYNGGVYSDVEGSFGLRYYFK